MARLSIVLVVLAATSSGAVRSKELGGRVSVLTAATNVSGSGEDDGTDTECMCKPDGLGAGRSFVQSWQTIKKHLLQAVEQKNGVSTLAPFSCKADHDKCSDCVIGFAACCTVSSGNTPMMGCGEHTFGSQKDRNAAYMKMMCRCGEGMSAKTIFKSNIAKGSGWVAKPTCTPAALCSECCGGSKKVCDGTYGENGKELCPNTKAKQDDWDTEHGVGAREHARIGSTEQAKATEPSSDSTPSVSSDPESAPAQTRDPAPPKDTSGQWGGKQWKNAGQERAAKETGVSYGTSGDPAAPSSSSGDTEEPDNAGTPLTKAQKMALHWEKGAGQWGK